MQKKPLLFLTVDSITMFINATRLSAEQLVINVSSFIEENEQIISDIDSLIARLSDIHSRVNTVSCYCDYS